MKKSRLIEVSEVKKKLRSVKDWFGGPPQTEQDKLAQAVVKMCIEEVDKLKPVDAVEVVHGHWIETKEGTICSECHEYPFSDGYFAIANYNGDWCPNCGAKMDGEMRNEYA